MNYLEKDIERGLVGMVKRHGGLALKWVCPGWAGVPDRIVLLPGGLIIFVELKRPRGGEVAKLQLWWKNKLESLGFQHCIVRNQRDLADLELLIIENGL